MTTKIILLQEDKDGNKDITMSYYDIVTCIQNLMGFSLRPMKGDIFICTQGTSFKIKRITFINMFKGIEIVIIVKKL